MLDKVTLYNLTDQQTREPSLTRYTAATDPSHHSMQAFDSGLPNLSYVGNVGTSYLIHMIKVLCGQGRYPR